MKIPIYAEIDRLRTENKDLKVAIHGIANAWHAPGTDEDIEGALDYALKIANGG